MYISAYFFVMLYTYFISRQIQHNKQDLWQETNSEPAIYACYISLGLKSMLLLRSLYINDVIHVCEIFKVKDLKDILTLNIYMCISKLSPCLS